MAGIVYDVMVVWMVAYIVIVSDTCVIDVADICKHFTCPFFDMSDLYSFCVTFILYLVSIFPLFCIVLHYSKRREPWVD